MRRERDARERNRREKRERERKCKSSQFEKSAASKKDVWPRGVGAGADHMVVVVSSLMLVVCCMLADMCRWIISVAPFFIASATVIDVYHTENN